MVMGSSRYQTEAKEAGSPAPRGVSRTTGVTKAGICAAEAAGWATVLL
jgi:hypothetical protein